MAFTFEERPGSRASTKTPPTFTYIYTAAGEQNDNTVSGYALAATPLTVFTASGNVLHRQDIRIDPLGYAIYVVTVPYGLRTRATGSYSFDFSTGGRSSLVTVAREHIATYPAGGDPNPYNGAVNVVDGIPQGVDFPARALRFTVRYTHPLGVVSFAYMKALHDVTTFTNSVQFLGFAPGELLFMGANGSDGTQAEADVAYDFEGSPNITGASLGGITGIAKKGHEYIWAKFKDDVIDGKPVVRPTQVHVERLTDSFNFAAVFGWGGP